MKENPVAANESLNIEFDILDEGVSPKIVLHGDIDFRFAPRIRDAVISLLEQGYKCIELKLAAVVFVDSSGLSALLDSVKRARSVGAKLVLDSPSRQLTHLLEVTGFRPLFELENLPEEHLAGPAPGGLAESPFNWQMTEFTIPCNPPAVADIRRRVGQVAESMPFTEDQVEDIKLAVGEASTNAFRYGCPNGDMSSIFVRAVGDSKSLTVEIKDSGPGFDPEEACPPVFGCTEPGGRGIWFMRLTMDKVTFIPEENGTKVVMVKFTPHKSGVPQT